MKIRTRFAPSPTGFLHVGSLRTALFAWLLARHDDGEFFLRIEDTDRQRHVAEAEQHIIETLSWLGLSWDNQIYRQSEHLNIYKEWAQKLIDKGRAYADPLTPEQVDKLRDQAKAAKQPFLFRNYRPDNPPAWQDGIPLRFKSEPKNYSWRDEVMGDLSTGPSVVDDFILIKSDGYPIYNFAHIIDDHLMNISHVIRSQEFIASVPNFLNLYEALAIEPPKMATLPYVLAPSGQKKLSKRDAAKDALDYRDEGYLPEALVNFLATLGWNDGTKQEIFSTDELIKKFSLDRVQKSGARFDEKRLEWMNGQYIAKLSDDELFERLEKGGFWTDEKKSASEDYKKKIISLAKLRMHTLRDINILSELFFKEPDPKAVALLLDATKISKPTMRKMLEAAKNELQNSDFTEGDIKQRLNNLLDVLNTKPAVLFSVIRIAISGQAYSPELFGSLAVLGKTKSLGRLQKTLNSLSD